MHYNIDQFEHGDVVSLVGNQKLVRLHFIVTMWHRTAAYNAFVQDFFHIEPIDAYQIPIIISLSTHVVRM